MALPLFALLLLTADPAAAPAGKAVKAHVAAPAAKAAKAPVSAADYTPPGAPADDFGFVAWCDGVLSGHMDLAERVQDVLPMDEVQQKIGRAYLHAYEEALSKSKEGATAAGRERARLARAQGWGKWELARKADKKLAADTYLAWQLPGRCEHAAVRVSGRKDLFRLASAGDESEVIGRRDAAPEAAAAPVLAPAPEPARAVAEAAPALPAAPSRAQSSFAQSSLAQTSLAEPAAQAMPALPAAPIQVAEASPAAATESARPAEAPAAETAIPAPPSATPAAPAQPVDMSVVHMPSKGHLLPQWLFKWKKKTD